MSSPRYARLASALLARRSDAAPPPSPQARAAAITAIEGAIRARARSRRLWRTAAGLAAAAAVVTLVAVFGAARLGARRAAVVASAVPQPPARAESIAIVAHPGAGGASLVVSGTQAPLADGRELAAGSRVVTPPSGRAALTFSTGTKIALAESADLTVTSQGATQAFRLAGGSIELQVAKLSSGQRFLVETPDAEIEVRGTQFRVSIVPADPACGAGSVTRVNVSEGVVVVRGGGREARVAAGQQWPSGCAVATSAAVEPRARRRAAARAPAASETGAEVARTATPTGSTLADQNDLFARAVAAKQRGDASSALEAFDRFLDKYPSGPLTESAAVERMRLLAATSPARGAEAAGDYLSRYPRGFARAEAEALARGAP